MSGRALALSSVAVMALTVLAACSSSSSQAAAKRTATPFPSPPKGQLLQSPSPYSGPGGGPARQPTGKLQPKDLMSKDPKTMTFGGGPGQNVSATFPGEYVYPSTVSVFTNVAIPLVGQVAYLVSPDSTADAAPVGTYSNHNPAPASGRVLQIETAKATDANAFAQGPLKTSIQSAGGILTGGLLTMPAKPGTAYGYEFTYKGETARRVAVVDGPTLVIVMLMAPTAQWTAELANLQAVLASLGT